MLRVVDPIAACTDLWDRNFMNPGCITSDLIPAGVTAPQGTAGGWNGKDLDAEGNPLLAGPSEHHTGHYVPHLTKCVVEGTLSAEIKRSRHLSEDGIGPRAASLQGPGGAHLQRSAHRTPHDSSPLSVDVATLVRNRPPNQTWHRTSSQRRWTNSARTRACTRPQAHCRAKSHRNSRQALQLGAAS